MSPYILATSTTEKVLSYNQLQLTKQYHIIVPREYPLTAAYAKFVNAGLIEHIRQGGKPVSLPAGVQNAT